MSERLLLIDTDMLVLLAASDMLATVANVLEVSPSQLRRLPAAAEQLKRGRDFRRTYTAAAIQAALPRVQSVQSVTNVPQDTELIDLLSQSSNIQEGEAHLFALLAEHSTNLLTTGDRRAIVDVATNPALRAVRPRVAGRIVCLEQTLRAIVSKVGAQMAGAAFLELRSHRTIRILLSDVQIASDARCLDGIESYLKELVREVGDDLLLPMRG